MPPLPISTSRLDLVAITPDALRAEVSPDGGLALLLDCFVPPGWPHSDWEPHVLELLQSTFAEQPEDIGWHRYILMRSSDSGPATLIGTCGAFRWPACRTEAEFGYAILPEFRLHGYAIEAAQAMLAWIEAQNSVSTIVAHTFPELVGSVRILERCNFTPTGAGAEARTLRYVKLLAP